MSEDMEQKDIVERRCLRPDCSEKFQCAPNSEQRYCAAHRPQTISVKMASTMAKVAKPSEDYTPKKKGDPVLRTKFFERASALRDLKLPYSAIADKCREEGILTSFGKPVTTKAVYQLFYFQDRKNQKKEKKVEEVQAEEALEKMPETQVKSTAPPLVRAILFAGELSAEKRLAMLVAYFEPETV